MFIAFLIYPSSTMAKNIRTEYSRLVINSQSPVVLTRVLLSVENVPQKDRLIEVDNVKYRLGEFHQSPKGRYFFGNVFRVRDDDLPPVASANGELRDLEIGDDEGLGEENAFLIDTSLEIVAYQSNRYGVSLSRLLEILGDLSELSGYLSAEPILELDAVGKAMTFERFSKISVKLANISDHLLQTPGDRSLIGLCDSAMEFEAPHATLTLSMGHKSGSLSLARVQGFITNLMNGHDYSGLKALEISGKEPDQEKATVLDLVKNIIKDFELIHPNQRRRYTFTTRMNAVKRCYRNRKNEFQMRYG